MNFSEDELKFLIKVLVLNYAEDESDFDQHDIRSDSICDKLIGQIIYDNKSLESDLMKYYYSVRKKKYNFSQTINKELFMGAGNKSVVWKNNLHKRFEYAVAVLSGMQQNGGMGTEFDEKSDLKDRQTIKDVLKDFLIAFGLTLDDLK